MDGEDGGLGCRGVSGGGFVGRARANVAVLPHAAS